MRTGGRLRHGGFPQETRRHQEAGQPSAPPGERTVPTAFLREGPRRIPLLSSAFPAANNTESRTPVAPQSILIPVKTAISPKIEIGTYLPDMVSESVRATGSPRCR